MKKRGQITLFIILGIIIISVISIAVFFRTQLIREGEDILIEELALPSDVMDVRNHIEHCIETTSKEGLILMGLQSGWITPLPNSLEIDSLLIPYIYDQGNNYLISMEEMKLYYANYIDYNSIMCFNPDNYPNLEIEEFQPNTIIDVRDNEVITSTEYRVIVSRDGSSYNLFTPYRFSHNVRLRFLYDITSAIMQKTIIEPDLIDLNYLGSFDLEIELLNVEENKMLYILSDEQSNIDGEPFTFIFANRF